MPTCQLCQEDREICQSHIIPKFVFDFVKRTSATGYMRMGTEPNRRVQDGRKRPLLCHGCEQLFSRWEGSFAKNVFHPYNANTSAVIDYGPWLCKFLVSVSWRVLLFYKLEGSLDELPTFHRGSIEEALETWREFLLDMRPHPGVFEQHLLPLDALRSTNVPGMPTNMNRYILRAVDMDIVLRERTIAVYWKLPRFVVLGLVVNTEPRSSWGGTRAAVKRGRISPRSYGFPRTIFKHVMDQAQKADGISKGLSSRQQEMISRAMLNDIDRVGGSESTKALIMDIEFFGLAALDASFIDDGAQMPDIEAPRDAG
jgi:hypothetical protein